MCVSVLPGLSTILHSFSVFIYCYSLLIKLFVCQDMHLVVYINIATDHAELSSKPSFTLRSYLTCASGRDINIIIAYAKSTLSCVLSFVLLLDMAPYFRN